MRELLKPMLPMILVLLAPIITFVLFGEQMEAWIAAWQANPPARAWVAAAVVGLLASDIFLPVPSSMISTFAGGELGVWLGTLASWVGMSLGAMLGFALARRFGPGVALWLTRPDDLERAARLSQHWGPWLLALGRGVPVLAEATVLLMGLHQLPWRRFLPPVLLSNLGLAIAYSGLGQYAADHHWLPMSLAVSIALPVLLAASFRFWSRAPAGETPSPPK